MISDDRAAYRQEQQTRLLAIEAVAEGDLSLEQAQAAIMAAGRPQCRTCLQRGHGCTGTVCVNAHDPALD